MKKHKFKVGDKVTILQRAVSVSVEQEDVGKIGMISSIDKIVNSSYGLHVQMDKICKVRGFKPQWSVGCSMVELVVIKGRQLEFAFMNE